MGIEGETIETSFKPSAPEDTSNGEVENNFAKEEGYTTEQVINVVGSKVTWRTVLVWVGLMSFMAAASNGSFYPAFGGLLPDYKTWKCVSTSRSCLERTGGVTVITNSTFTVEEAKVLMCGDEINEPLKEKIDFLWDIDGRSTYAVEWGLYCSTGRTVLYTVSGSVGYFGHLVGSLCGNFYDVFGRKYGALIGCLVLFVNNFILVFSPNITFFLVFRFIWGVALMCAMDGIFVLMLEYTPTKYRAVVNSGYQFFWAVGYIISPLGGYFITSWKWLLVLNSGLVVIPTIILFIMPDSPGYFLVNKKNESEAKKSLNWFRSLNNHNFDIDGTCLREEEGVTEERTFVQSLADFITYKEMTIQASIQAFMWFVVGFLYYGFTFTWANFSEGSIYLSYLWPALAEGVAYISMTIPLTYIGRKITLSSFYFIACASFIFAQSSSKIPGFISVEQLSCLVGSTFISAAFGSVYIYTAELAPTSHRGKIMGICHLGSQIGAVAGPQAKLLIDYWSKPGTLVLYAALAGLAGLLCLRLPDTKGVSVPDTAQEVQARRKP